MTEILNVNSVDVDPIENLKTCLRNKKLIEYIFNITSNDFKEEFYNIVGEYQSKTNHLVNTLVIYDLQKELTEIICVQQFLQSEKELKNCSNGIYECCDTFIKETKNFRLRQFSEKISTISTNIISGIKTYITQDESAGKTD
ncbi:uncharacterized protein LOC126904404 isoform X2 [Daktulosphaira vitifoliae]|uniref:uncharacterized protein LOC126904404 isoform X2 n=1 Tax=Daktulosphaira vitifoliae TaxID=58002 RepID=UPI0021A98000|nr:uncharacterized protein LOC126904404 isoform X2 [Daktulosphaira vitifoliae]